MSASLVGSEMCIRDRSRSGAQAARPSSQCRLRNCMWRLIRSALTALAVSYTHLTLPTICSV
eukprot:13962401-Alexandrium_andersonii.AAC.1